MVQDNLYDIRLDGCSPAYDSPVIYFHITMLLPGGFLVDREYCVRKRHVSAAPGNANLPIGGLSDANREVGVPRSNRHGSGLWRGYRYHKLGWRARQSFSLS
jgi:hypothetical protein